MPGMTPPPATQMMNHTMQMDGMMGFSHMTFFWSKNSEILFSGWPGTRTGMYVLALLFVFLLSFIAEWLSCPLRNPKTNGLTQTLLHGIWVGVAYLVMLAVMSFNVGVLIVAIVGHVLGYFVFGSGLVFKSPKGPCHNVLPC